MTIETGLEFYSPLPLTIVDPNGLSTALAQARSRVYSSLNRIFQELGSTGQTTEYAYDTQGNVTNVKDPLNRNTANDYDSLNRLIKVTTLPAGEVITSAPLTYHTSTLNAPGDQSIASTSCPVVAASFATAWNNYPPYGSNGAFTYGYVNNSCSAPKFACTTGSTLTFQLACTGGCGNTYNLTASVVGVSGSCEIVPAGGSLTQYAYNGQDALTGVTDPRSLVTGYSVDGLGNLTQQSSPDTGTTANTYDTAGNLATQTDAKGQATAYVYDALNRVTLITFHDGSKQAYAYDLGANGVGRLSSITETNAALQVTSLIAYAYDQKGRVTAETRTVNGVPYVLAYSYDSSGRLTGMTYPSGRTVTYSLDALGRVSQVTTTKDNQSQVVVQNVQYHPFGGAKSWTLGNGQIYSRTVDQDGRIASYTLGATNNTIAFDAASRITGINTNIYGYDALDRLNSAILPSSNFAYSYDAVGNRLTKTVGANTDTYTYGATSNRIATLTPAAGSPRSFVLDANGSTTNDALNTYAYDTRGRMAQSTNAASTVTSYQVNALGQRIRKTNSSDDRVFTYDTWGKLIAESDPGGTPKRELIYLGDIPVGVLQ